METKFHSTETSTLADHLEVLAHDLRSPLNSISGLVELLKIELKDQNNEQVQKCLDLINESCEHSNTLLSKMLRSAELKSHQASLQKEELNLTKLVANAVNTHELVCASQGIKLSFKASHPHIAALIDPCLWRDAMNNLISNAIKFTPKGGKIEIQLIRRLEYTEIIIQDTGIGIDENLLPVLFDKFTKARRKGLRGENSTGLGMSIVKQIVEAHEGKIAVKSKVNQGTKVMICLPR